jgi:tRNA G26 N,N-dimethylase Trm1
MGDAWRQNRVLTGCFEKGCRVLVGLVGRWAYPVTLKTVTPETAVLSSFYCKLYYKSVRTALLP